MAKMTMDVPFRIFLLQIWILLVESAPMDRYIDRLISFSIWPDSSLTSTVLLADDGFYYTGEGDVVECFQCHITLGDWLESHVPSIRHIESSPDCPFALSRIHITTNHGNNHNNNVARVRNHTESVNSNNIQTNPLSEGATTCDFEQMWHRLSLHPVETVYARENLNRHIINDANRMSSGLNSVSGNCDQNIIRNGDNFERNVEHTNSQHDQSNNEDKLTINNEQNSTVSCSYEQNPDYTRYDHRLLTFTNRWPSYAPISPEEVANAGFILIGPEDRVQCFWCRGIIYNWEDGDTAIGEHKRHFPQCPFIKKKLQELLNVEARNITSSQHVEARNTTSSYHHGNSQVEEEFLIQKDDMLINKEVQNDYQLNIEDYPAVQIALQLEYSPNIVKMAAMQILENPNIKLNTDNLLDKITELDEDDTIFFRNEKELQEGAVGYAAYNVQNIEKLDSKQKNLLLPKNKTVDWVDFNQPKNHQNVTCYNPDPPPWNYTAIQAPDNKTPQKKMVGLNQEIFFNTANMTEDVSSLLEENNKLKETTTCKICLDRDVNLLFLPCRHLVCCEGCGDQVKLCPVCRMLIAATVKTFLS